MLISAIPLNFIPQIEQVKATTIFSDGFESGDLSQWTGNTTTATYGFLDVQSTTVQNGTYALNSTVTSDASWTHANCYETISEES